MATSAGTLELGVAPPEVRRGAGFWSDAWYRIRRDPPTIVAIAVLSLLVILALSADLLADHFFHWSFTKQDILNNYEPPNPANPPMWLGSDQLGRSQIVRLLYAGRVSLFIGVFGAAVSLVVGVVIGISAGYFRGWWDDVVVWVITTLASIPTLFLLIIVGALFRLPPPVFAVFLGLLGWLGIANLARGQTFALREREFVVAARTIGARPGRVMFRHIFPNLLPLMIILAMTDIGNLILAESALSYLGFGIQPPTPSWGNMLTGASLFISKGPWLVYPPGAIIFVTVLCLYLIGDGLRDALDPRLRGTETR
jgi:peptide/nickel transport system permease protein